MAAVNTNGYTTADALDPNQNVVFDPMYNDLVPKATYDARRAGGQSSPPNMQPQGQLQPPAFSGSGGLLAGAQPPAQAQFNATQGLDRAQQAQIDARGNVIPYQQAQIDASRTANAAQGNVYNATANTFPIQQAAIGAKGAVLDQQGIQNQMQQGFIGQEQQANTARIGDTNAVVQARGNTADQTAVAMYNEQQAGNNGIYSSEGLGAPQRVVTAGNQGGALAPGVIGDVQTQEQRVAQEAKDREDQRSLQLNGAKPAVDLQSTNVQAAEQAAARVDLRLDQANLLVSQASNQANQAKLGESNAALDTQQANLGVTQAGIGVDQAQFNLNLSKQPTNPGDVPVIDPTTGVQAGWGTPAQAAQAKLQFDQNQSIANSGTNSPIVDPNTGVQIGWGTPAQSEASKQLYSQNMAIQGRQTQGQLYGSLAQMTEGQLTDLAITDPQQRGLVENELKRRGYSPQAAAKLIADAAPRKASGGGSGITIPGLDSTSSTGAAVQNSYNTTAAAISGGN